VQIVLAHQLGHERLAHRGIESGGAAEQKGEDIDMPKPHQPGDGENAQRQSQHAHRRLRHQQKTPLVEMIGRRSRPGQQQELRPELQGHHHTDGRGVMMRQLGQHQPILCRALDPGADVGHERARHPHPIVEAAQGAEGAAESQTHTVSLISVRVPRP
jgi:hypothetical protein